MYVAVQPFTIPVVLLYFSRLPLGALIANFLVAPLVAPILIFSVIGMAMAKIPMIGPILLQLTDKFTKLFLCLIHYSAKFSHPLTVPLGKLPFFLWICGGALIFFACRLPSRYKRTVATILSAILFITAFVNTLFPFPHNQLTVTFTGAKNTNSAVITTPADRLILYGTLQDIAYGRGSSYEESASVALIILTEIPNSEQADTLLQELPQAPVVCSAGYESLHHNIPNFLFVSENYATKTDGIRIRLFADETALYEAEFSYGEHQFSFSQNADYILRNSHINPDKIWIVNFQRKSKTTEQLSKIPNIYQLLSKNVWHPDTKLYDNSSVLIFSKGDITFYGTKEQNLLWN